MAAHLRAFELRLAQIDEGFPEDETSEPLLELDALRVRLGEVARGCESLPARAAPREPVEEALKRLARALQALEACRDLDQEFSARLEELARRVESLAAELAPAEEAGA